MTSERHTGSRPRAQRLTSVESRMCKGKEGARCVWGKLSLQNCSGDARPRVCLTAAGTRRKSAPLSGGGGPPSLLPLLGLLAELRWGFEGSELRGRLGVTSAPLWSHRIGPAAHRSAARSAGAGGAEQDRVCPRRDPAPARACAVRLADEIRDPVPGLGCEFGPAGGSGSPRGEPGPMAQRVGINGARRHALLSRKPRGTLFIKVAEKQRKSFRN